MARSARSYQQEADELRARGCTYGQIAAAWRSRYAFNSRVAFRLAHGLTQAEVARRWNERWPDADAPKTAKHISYWEVWPGPAGRAPSIETLNRLAFLYQCSAGELLDGEDHSHLDTARLAVHVSEADLRTQSDAPAPEPKITKVTDHVVADFELRTDTYRQLDYREGAASVRAELTVHLRQMLAVSNRTIGSDVHKRLLRAAGDAAQLAGWFAIDAQRYDQAGGLCNLAANLAEKANDRALHAYSLGVLSYIHLHAGDGSAALAVLHTADDVAKRGVPAAVVSWLREAAGEAHGYAGQRRQGLVALAESERVFDRVTTANTPKWLAFFNADCHAARLKGRCLTRLGQPHDATRALYEALALLPPTFVRERSGTLIDLASAYLQMRQVEQACATAVEADQLARRTGSERNRKRLHHLLVDMMPWTELDCVQGLYRQVLLN